MMSKHAPKIGEHGVRPLSQRALFERITDIAEYCVIWERETKTLRKTLTPKIAQMHLAQLAVVQTKLNLLRARLSEIADWRVSWGS